jgi:hypothetical protein
MTMILIGMTGHNPNPSAAIKFSDLRQSELSCPLNLKL